MSLLTDRPGRTQPLYHIVPALLQSEFFDTRSATAYEESHQFQTQSAGRLDIIPEPLPGSGHDLQPLELHLLCRPLPSKISYRQRSLRCELHSQKGPVLPPAPTLPGVRRAKRQIVQSYRVCTKCPLHESAAL